MKAHITAATSTHGGHYILSSLPTYDGIDVDEYIAWELKIDNIFAQCRMCERRKIKNATSVLTNSALVWWEDLCALDKPKTWNGLKINMRENFVQQHLEEAVSIAPPPMPNLLQDVAKKKVDYAKENVVLAMSCELLDLSTGPAPTISENEIKGNKKSVTLTQGENSFDELTLSTNQQLVESLTYLLQDDLPMLQEDFIGDSCDKEELCVDSSISHVPQLVENCDTFS
jgi:hypothetical protein